MRVLFEAEPSISPAAQADWWVLNADFNAHVYKRIDKPPTKIVVPAGYLTDLASIPHWTPLTRSYLQGTARRSAILHDFLYSTQAGKAFADDVFRAAMVTEGVPRCVRWLLFSAVHWFGGGPYIRSATRHQQ